jgi:hypothetical protein
MIYILLMRSQIINLLIIQLITELQLDHMRLNLKLVTILIVIC